MAYNKTVWENDITPIDADKMNNIENGIEEVRNAMSGNNSMGSIIVEDVKCKNLFSSSNLTNATIDGSGGLITENRRLVSDYINIKNINQLTLSFNTALTFLGLAYYDVDKNFISRTIANNVQILTSDTPSNATYVRGFFQSNSETEKLTEASLLKYEVLLEKGPVATNYVEHKEFGITSGSNENGHWIKYADGTMIQRGTIDKTKYVNPSTLSSTVQNIIIYRSALVGVVFPQQFYSTDYSLHIDVGSGTSGSRLYVSRYSSPTKSGFENQLLSLENFIETSVGYTNLTNVKWTAIGRWK